MTKTDDRARVTTDGPLLPLLDTSSSKMTRSQAVARIADRTAS